MSKKLDKSDGLNLSLFAPKSVWSAPGQFPNLSDVKLLGVDIESKDPNLHAEGPGFLRGTAEPVGVSLATDDKAWYFPFKHLGGGNLDKGSVVNYLKDVLGKPTEKVFANGPYDLEGLHSMGVTVKGKLYDIQINEALLDEEREEGYDLGTLCEIHLGTKKDETLLKDAALAYGVNPKGGLWKLPAKYVGPYAEYDALATIKIFRKQLIALEKQDLMQVFDLETRLLPLLFAMRIQGTPVDLEAASKLSDKLRVEEEVMRFNLTRDYGKFNDQSGQDLAKICDRLKVSYPRTTKGNASFEGKWLEEHEHPFLKAISDLRQLSKLKSDYVDKIIKHSINGRLHIQWKQLVSDDGGARTGRLAAANPPLQQFPASKKRNGKPNPIGAAIRGLLIAPPGMKWMKGDYSQQEPRILTHFAAVCNLAGAEAAAFSYRSNPDMDFYKFMMDIAHIERRPAKTLYLARCYGMGKDKMAASLGVSKGEAAAMLQNMDESLPFISALADKCMQLAQNRGYIKTLCGRKRHFNYWEPSDAYAMRQERDELFRRGELTPSLACKLDTTPRPLVAAKARWPNKSLLRSLCHKALNALIQGSAADMMKAGLVKCYEEDGRVPFITVHDEVGGAVVDEQDAKHWKYQMEHCVDLCVPINMDVTIGKGWK